MNDFKYVFGPIPSRRLGRSLGISPLPKKTCNYSCIYCQLGRTDKMTNKRQEFYKTEDIIAEFKQYLKDSDKFDIVTVVGEGEPTLAANLGELVVALKALTDKPVAVITNGALLSDPQVREELCHADMVLPSLDAYNQEISKKIDRLMERSNLKKNLTEGGKKYRPIHFWINWPCNDNTKQHLILGGGEKFLHPNVDLSLAQGIMLNPMQQSEASKVALFDVAQYGWKQWRSAEEAEKINDMPLTMLSMETLKKAKYQKPFVNLASICATKTVLHMSQNWKNLLSLHLN